MMKTLKEIAYSFLRKGTKIGASYNLFDGEELLEASITSVRNSVYHISVVYQTVSNFGNPASHDLEEKLQDLKQKGLIDEIYHYTPDLKKLPTENEKKKRDIGLKLAKKSGCNYFISLDTDEFYDGEKFEKAVAKIIKYNIKISAVGIIEYLKSPENQLIGDYSFTPDRSELYNFYVPFIIKINKFSRQKHGEGYFPCIVDPTRKLYHPGRFRLFSLQEVAMHHMSTVRKDLEKKFANSSLVNPSKEDKNYLKSLQNEVLDFEFENSKILPEDCAVFRKNIVRKVENKFNIDP